MAADVRNALASTDEVEITVTGRTSGRPISNPVWFVQEQERVYLVPIHGSDSDWFRNVSKTPMIRLSANGQAIDTSATPITEAGRVGAIVEKFRDKYGAQQIRYHYPKTNVAVEVPLA